MRITIDIPEDTGKSAAGKLMRELSKLSRFRSVYNSNGDSHSLVAVGDDWTGKDGVQPLFWVLLNLPGEDNARGVIDFFPGGTADLGIIEKGFVSWVEAVRFILQYVLDNYFVGHVAAWPIKALEKLSETSKALESLESKAKEIHGEDFFNHRP